MAVKRRVRARSMEDLHPIWEWIQDAEFSTAEVAWDRAAGTVVVPITSTCRDADFPPRKHAERTVWNDWYFEPCFRATLTFHGVRAVRPEPHELIEPGDISDIEWHADRGAVEVHSHADSHFELDADGLDVELSATDEIDHWHKAYYGRVIPWEGRGRAIEAPPG